MVGEVSVPVEDAREEVKRESFVSERAPRRGVKASREGMPRTAASECGFGLRFDICGVAMCMMCA